MTEAMPVPLALPNTCLALAKNWLPSSASELVSNPNPVPAITSRVNEPKTLENKLTGRVVIMMALKMMMMITM